MVVEGSGTEFVLEKAPRSGYFSIASSLLFYLIALHTAIGFDAFGNVNLIQVDGQENIDKGMDLYEFSNLIISLGIVDAINMDGTFSYLSSGKFCLRTFSSLLSSLFFLFSGGGSSESVYMGKVISLPTCMDNATICERPISTGTCLTIPSSI